MAIVESLLLFGGFIGTVTLGLPVALALSKPKFWRTPVRAVTQPAVAAAHVRRAYEPLALDPDPMIWPSERPWTAPVVPEPDWPSKSWNDEHFGTHWREKAARDEQGQAPQPTKQASRPPAKLGDGAPAEAAFFQETAPPVLSQRDMALQQRQRQQQTAINDEARAAQHRIALQQARKTSAPAPTKAPPKPAAQPKAQATQASIGGPPDRAETERLMNQVGLAGTVQAIMDRTGWDFRESAHYLAKIRQGH